ncbi:MAG: hypothetical protein ACR2MY_00550 [Candidatus Dormibacteria bacterium]
MAIDLATSPTRRVDSDSTLNHALRERLVHRGWSFRTAGASVTAHRPEWPGQLCVLVRAAEEETPVMLGLAVEFSSMPLRGERFRDVFNSEREELLRSYGNFRLLQQSGDGSWVKPLSHRSFLHGMVDGISRKTHLAVFDRSSDDRGDLAEAFAADSNRFVETGSPIGAVLQRLYQRTVLSVPVTDVGLPDVVRPSIGVFPLTAGSSDSPYPWRR